MGFFKPARDRVRDPERPPQGSSTIFAPVMTPKDYLAFCRRELPFGSAVRRPRRYYLAFSERAEGPSETDPCWTRCLSGFSEVVPDIRHSSSYPSSTNLIADSLALTSDTFGVGLHVHATVQRIKNFRASYPLKSRARVLDGGCRFGT